MTPAALRALAALAEARKAQALARLDAALRDDRRLAAEAEALARAPAEDLADAHFAMPPARYGVRLAWAEQRLARIRARRADLALEIARLRAAATLTFGRHQALDHLTARAEADAARLRADRAEREAPPPEPPSPGGHGAGRAERPR